MVSSPHLTYRDEFGCLGNAVEGRSVDFLDSAPVNVEDRFSYPFPFLPKKLRPHALLEIRTIVVRIDVPHRLHS